MAVASEQLQINLTGPQSTEQLGAAIARIVSTGDVILLSGELGAGKTVLTKGFVRAISPTTLVTSPTFSLCHLYETKPRIAHVDCWRLKDLSEFVDLGIDEVLELGGLAIIEWGELAIPLYGNDALMVHLSDGQSADGSDQLRVATLKSASSHWHDRLPALEALLKDSGIEGHDVDREQLGPT